MSVSSQDQLFSCRWARCRSAFSNDAGLVHHVVHDHVLCAIPVRRRDISVIKRAEEGKGASLKISIDMYSISHRSVDLLQEPSSSLTSPPASSPAPHSPQDSPGPAPSQNSLLLEQKENLESTSPDDASRQHSPPLPSSKLLQGQNLPGNQTATFASLSSPEPRLPFSSEMPDSPSFSSLVERPNQRQRTSILGNVSRNKTHANQLHLLSPSQPSSASFTSQNFVEAQLTQTQDDDMDMDQDEDFLLYHSPNELSSQAPDIFNPYFELIHEHDELQWELSQPAEEYLRTDTTSQSQSNGHHHLENLPVMSQPPSQLRLDSEFSVYFHDHPQGSASKAPHTDQPVLDPSAAVPLSPSSPAPSPIFAASTPVRQNWYQPPLKRRKRSTCNDKNSHPFPLKMEVAFGSPTKSKKMFRSGTLPIRPTSLSGKHVNVDALPSGANRQDNLATRSRSPYDLFSQSSQDSSDFSKINSYPALQTQAPYQSQILTQF